MRIWSEIFQGDTTFLINWHWHSAILFKSGEFHCQVLNTLDVCQSFFFFFFQEIIWARTWLNDKSSGCLLEANRFSDIFFYLKIWSGIRKRCCFISNITLQFKLFVIDLKKKNKDDNFHSHFIKVCNYETRLSNLWLFEPCSAKWKFFCVFRKAAYVCVSARPSDVRLLLSSFIISPLLGRKAFVFLQSSSLTMSRCYLVNSHNGCLLPFYFPKFSSVIYQNDTCTEKSWFIFYLKGF